MPPKNSGATLPTGARWCARSASPWTKADQSTSDATHFARSYARGNPGQLDWSLGPASQERTVISTTSVCRSCRRLRKRLSLARQTVRGDDGEVRRENVAQGEGTGRGGACCARR